MLKCMIWYMKKLIKLILKENKVTKNAILNSLLWHFYYLKDISVVNEATSDNALMMLHICVYLYS